MDYKKYSIDDSYERAISNLMIITDNMYKNGQLKKGEMWSKPIKLTGLVVDGEGLIETSKWFFENPSDKQMMEFTNTLEQTDINPNSVELDYFIIYTMMYESSKKNFKDWTIAPHSLDYKKDIVKIYDKQEFNDRGELVEVVYYEKATPKEDGTVDFENPVVRYEATYFYNALGYTTSREVKRQWMSKHGTWGGDKVTKKFYNNIQSREASIRRRKNLISNVILNVVYLIYKTEDLNNLGESELLALPFFKDLGEELSFYYESGNKSKEGENFPLYERIKNSPESWMENEVQPGLTIRNYILAKIDI